MSFYPLSFFNPQIILTTPEGVIKILEGPVEELEGVLEASENIIEELSPEFGENNADNEIILAISPITQDLRQKFFSPLTISNTNALQNIQAMEEKGYYHQALAKTHYSFKSLATQIQAFSMVSIIEEKILHYGFLHRLICRDRSLRPLLFDLFKIFNSNNSTQSIHVNDIQKLFQKKIISTKKKFKISALEKKKELQAVEHLKSEGFLNSINSHLKFYSGVIIFPKLFKKLSELLSIWTQVRFEKIYLFCTEDLVTEKQIKESIALIDDYKNPMSLGKKDILQNFLGNFTQKNLFQWVWERLDLPPYMRATIELRLVVVKEAKQDKVDEAVKNWLKTTPRKGKYLIMSKVPYLWYHDITFRAYSPKEYTFDTTGENGRYGESIYAEMNSIKILRGLANCILPLKLYLEKPESEI